MDKALRIKEKEEATEKEVAEIKEKNIETMREKCRVDLAKKGERMEFLGRLHKERREALQEENIIRGQEARELLPKQIEQTQRLAEGVLRLKNKEIWEQKHRQVLRAQNIELKELESQLKSTYAAKGAQVQLKEREASRINEKYLEREAFRMRSRWYNDDAFDKELEREELDKRAKYRNALQDQLINNEILRQQRTEEEHRERKIIEEVSEVLHKENIHLAEEKKEKISHVQAERDAFFKAKEIWKCKEKEALLDEFDRQAEIIAVKMTEEKNQAVKKLDRSLARDLMMERTARRMLDDEVMRMEREDIANELIIEEQNNEVVMGMKNDAVKKEILKREFLADMERQKKLVAESKDRDAAVDDAFRKYLAEQYEISVRKENEKNYERRRKGIQYGKDLKTVRDEQRARHAEEILVRKALHGYDEKLELERLKEVSLERSKILYEHASKLDGFLRGGTLRQEDYEYMKTRECNPEKYPE